MNRFRPVGKLLRLQALIARDRWQSLRRRPSTLWLLAALSAPAAVIPLIQFFAGSAPINIPLLVLLGAQVGGWLRHPFEPRKSVRHPFPGWYFWLVHGLCIGGWITHSLEPRSTLATLFLFLAALSVLSTALPAGLAFVVALLRRLGLVIFRRRIRVSVSQSYGLLLLTVLPSFWLPLVAMAPVHSILGKPTFAFLCLVHLLPPLAFRGRLWSRKRTALSAALPQAYAWYLPVWVFTLRLIYGEHGWPTGSIFFRQSRKTYPPLDYFLSNPIFWRLYLVALMAWGFYELAIQMRSRLHYSPVQPTRIGDDEALSAQANSATYVDTSKAGERLVHFIEQSDGGVIGVTGVRGAGKSALIAHVLSRLERSFLTLSMTAPLRPDPGIGFLLNVCRAVARRVLDDIARGLYGRRTERGTALTDIFARARGILVIVTLAGLGVLLLLAKQTMVSGLLLERKELGPCSKELRFERRIVENLLGQLEVAGSQASRSAGADLPPTDVYLLVPRPDVAGFNLLPAGTSSPARQLELIRMDLSRTSGRFRSLELLIQAEHPRQLMLQALSEREFDTWLRADRPVSDLRHQRLSQGCEPTDALIRHHLRTIHATLDGSSRDPSWVGLELVGAFVKESSSLALDRRGLLRLHSLLGSYHRALLRERQSPSQGSFFGKADLVQVSFLVATVIAIAFLVAPAGRAVSALARSIANWRYVALYREARQFLELLHYSESRHAGASFSWRGLGVERSRALAARDLTLPALTSRYAEFVQSARPLYNGKMIVAIDELDKIPDPEMVKALLTEIKGALFTRGCYYLISISEDATRSFQRRLSSGRDIFESTFDDIVEIRRMSVQAATQMIEKRLGRRHRRLSRSCYFVLALFGGGIPREIVRNLREFRLNDQIAPRPRTVAGWLLRRELKTWQSDLGEVELPGAAAIELRQHVREAVAALGEEVPNENVCCDVWNRLQQALDTIDPSKLRLRVQLLPAGVQGNGAIELATYRVLVDDIQACLRLMLLTTICQLACGEKNAWKAYEEELLAVFGALADRPALAERMLEEIRAGL